MANYKGKLSYIILLYEKVTLYTYVTREKNT